MNYLGPIEKSEIFEPSKLDCAYAAGFFDGEGNVNIARQKRGDTSFPCYVLSVGASQVDPEPLVRIRDRWGGSICSHPARPPRKQFFTWQSHANVAAEFLTDIIPLLMVKRERAILAMRFQAIKRGQGKHRDLLARARLFEQFYRELRAMNGWPPNDMEHA